MAKAKKTDSPIETIDASPEVAMKTFVIEQGIETFEVTVPASWKTTFGPGVPPGMANNGFNRHAAERGWCLRFYETKELQRAFFANVTSFHDASIKFKKHQKEVEMPEVPLPNAEAVRANIHF